MEEQLGADQQTSRASSSLSTGLSTSFGVAESRATGLRDMLLDHPLVLEALSKLEKELPRDLKYHNFQHTVDVLSRTVELARLDGCSLEDITLLAIAAAWHDTGFIEQNTQNEPIAARMVEEAMRRSGDFSETDISDVRAAILDTQIKFDPTHKTLYQKSTARLSPWLLDADLSNFGQKDFMEKSVAVYSEMSGRTVNNAEDFKDVAGRAYLTSTIRLLSNHVWHSSAARTLYQQQERINLNGLGLLLAELHDGTEQGMKKAWEVLHPLPDLFT